MDVYEAIQHLEAYRRDAHLHPVCAMFNDIVQLVNMPIPQLKSELNQLYKDKRVDYFNTINSIAFITI